MTRPVHNPGSWPRLMRAATAAAYVDEPSVEAFLRRVGSVYPRPVAIDGRGDTWIKEALDAAIDAMDRSAGAVRRVPDIAGLV